MREEDRELFHRTMSEAVPLRGRRRPHVRSPPPKSPIGPPTPVAARRSVLDATLRAPPRPLPAAPPRTLDPGDDTGLDRATEQRLRRGQLAPEARLDLHGHTVADAERAMARFLERSQAMGCRVVLVVTGKGARSEGGVTFAGRIRAEFPHWVNGSGNRGRIFGVRAAHPRHGGGGAFYVMLRKAR